MKKEGYLFIDHTFSPGLPEDMARMSGMDPNLVREGKRLEAATLTCSHCKCVVIKNPLRISERSHCFKCNHYICDICAKAAWASDYNHTPFDKSVDLVMSGQPLGSPRKLLTP